MGARAGLVACDEEHRAELDVRLLLAVRREIVEGEDLEPVARRLVVLERGLGLARLWASSSASAAAARWSVRSRAARPAPQRTAHPVTSSSQLSVQESAPVAPGIAPAQVTPPKSLPSHSSPEVRTPSPHTGSATQRPSAQKKPSTHAPEASHVSPSSTRGPGHAAVTTRVKAARARCERRADIRRAPTPSPARPGGTRG